MGLPDAVERAIQESIDYLGENLQFDLREADTHVAVFVTGWNDTEDATRAVAKYLVGLIASCIDSVLTVRTSLLADTDADRLELRANVESMIGTEEHPKTVDEKREFRNPWIAEGLWHLCMVLAGLKRPEFHLPGAVRAVTSIHALARDPGPDVAVVFSIGGALGLTIVETKAYQNDPARAIRDAAQFFRQVDDNAQSLRVRQQMNALVSQLPPSVQKLSTPSFWKRIRCYVPNPHHSSAVEIDWASDRDVLAPFRRDNQIVMIMPHGVTDFADFFDEVASQMVEFVRSL